MAVIIGLTGGIGSGKTTIMKHIEQMGIEVYYADEAGKHVMEIPEVIEAVQQLFHESAVVTDGKLDRKKIAGIVFKDAAKLSTFVVNNIDLKQSFFEIESIINEFLR